MILPRHIFDPNNANARNAPANLQPISTGPYHVVVFKAEEVLFLGTELIQTIKVIFEPIRYSRRNPTSPTSAGSTSRAAASPARRLAPCFRRVTSTFTWNTIIDADTLQTPANIWQGTPADELGRVHRKQDPAQPHRSE